MKKTLAILAVMTLSPVVSALVPSDFVGEYKLTDGGKNCLENFSIVEFQKEGQTCLSFKRKNSNMDWAITNKLCNFNKATPVSIEEIPAPAFVGNIVHTDSTVLTFNTLYKSGTQRTEYKDGRTFLRKNDLYLSFSVDEKLVLEETLVKMDNTAVAEFFRSVCTYEK